MKLELDEKFSDFLRDKIVSNYRSRLPRQGKWHVSDLLFPRYAVLNRRQPHQPTNDEIGFFLTGEAYHNFIQELLGKQNSEVKAEAIDVLASADFFDGGTLIEFKTSRKWTIPETPEEHYIKQAAYYAFIFAVKSVRISVIYPTSGRKWDGSTSSTVEIRSWIVLFSDEDITEIKEEMTGLVKDMTEAYKTGDVSSLPECPEWKFGSIERDKEKQEYYIKIRCPFTEICLCSSSLKEQLEYKNAHRRK